MLFLSAEDLRRHFSIQDFLDAAEEAFLVQAAGMFSMPDRLTYRQAHGCYNVMPCFTERYLSNKVITTYPENARRGLPTIQGVVLLADAVTGAPLAMIDGPCLTGYRTGAMGGVSCKYLAPERATRVGVIGTGVQGLYQTLSAAAVRPIREVYAYSRDPENRGAFAARLAQLAPQLEVRLCSSAEEAARAGDILITATTAPAPVLPDEPALFQGKHIVAVGNAEPAKRELPTAAVKAADEIWTDTLYARVESGDLAIPISQGILAESQIQELARKVRAGLPSPFTRGATTLYKSVGLGLFDLVAAGRLYERAMAEGVGRTFDL